MLPEEEKKDGNSGEFGCRLERLERLIENQSFELQCTKRQHSKLQQQVVALKADLAAAEVLRQAAVDEQSLRRQVQDQDQQLLQTIQRQVLHIIKDSHNSALAAAVTVTPSSSTSREQPSDRRLLQELSLAVQQHSSDQLEQREALQCAVEEVKSVHDDKIKQIQGTIARLCQALKDMAVEQGTNKAELIQQVQQQGNDIRVLSSQAGEVERRQVQRQVDQQRISRGERLVARKETEKIVKALRASVESLTDQLQQQVDSFETITTELRAQHFYHQVARNALEQKLLTTTPLLWRNSSKLEKLCVLLDDGWHDSVMQQIKQLSEDQKTSLQEQLTGQNDLEEELNKLKEIVEKELKSKDDH